MARDDSKDGNSDIAIAQPLPIMAQVNPIVGDISYNQQLIMDCWQKATKSENHQPATTNKLIIFPELILTGYPPEDLLLQSAFITKTQAAIQQLAKFSANMPDSAALIGAPYLDEADGKLYNAALYISNGQIQQIIRKQHLPNHGVFDEYRYFEPKPNSPNLTSIAQDSTIDNIITYNSQQYLVLICEDMWFPEDISRYTNQQNQLAGIISINASPFSPEKISLREQHARDWTEKLNAPLYYCNMVGGQDELVFDGRSFKMNRNSNIEYKYPSWQESLVFASNQDNSQTHQHKYHDIYQAMMIGVRDYLRKSGFNKAIIGLSGGIDSALTMAVLADAIGSDNVRAVLMPSPFTSEESINDARDSAKRMGITLQEITITPAMNAYHDMLAQANIETPSDITAQNIQSRIRGNLLMALSNQLGALLITTGNKSEMAVGYATIYGDMCGAFSVLKDVYKMDVFAISRWRNNNIPEGSLCLNLNIIPDNIVTKPPTAELKSAQKDSDSLPEYEILDKILYLLIEELQSSEEIIQQYIADEKTPLFTPETVYHIEKLLRLSEYKRRQAPLGVILSSRSLGKDWRYPIAGKK